MARPGLLLGDVSLNHPESQAFSASNPRETLNQSSEKLLQGLLLVAVVGLGLRALLAAVLACQHRSTSQVEGKGLEVVPLLFFGKVIINVTLKVLATTSHGLLAVKWILAGEPAGFALVASFVLVAVNTQILVTVVQVGHLRHLLLKLGLTKQARVSFAGVGSLWQVPGGRACVAVNGIATLCLVVHLHQRPWQLLPWLATACGTLVWANASFQGVGVTTWNDLKPIATDDSAVMEAEEFMESLGVAESALPDTACGKWLALVAKMFTVGKENAIMLQNRQVLMHHAFPTNPTFRFFHGVVMVLFNLCCFGVPAALVAVSMMQVPVIHDLQVSGGALYPSLSPQQSHYYVRLNDGWTEGISFTFELDVGKASSFEFCCPFCVELTGSEHGNSLILKSEMPKENLGTCQLNLFGLRFQQYQFTALALQGLEMESRLDTEIGHFEPPFQAGLQTYESSFVSKSSASISLRVVLELDMENTKVAYTARWCTNRACSNELVEGEKEADITKPAQVGCFNLTLWITLSPASSMPNVSSVYEISVTVIDLKMKLDEIAFKMSELQAQMSALEDLDSPTENLKAELERTVLERDMYLEAAYRLEQPEDGFEEMRPDLTFLAVGLTGAGKSELCHWMTGNLDKCSPSNSMQSNTSQVQEVFAYPFDDFKLKPHIKWLDTPGRGDTRGETNDTKMWSQTMSFLVNRSNSEFVDRIVWVINAAWQRATAARQMIFRELRRSFGLHLYRHLDLLFNFLPHVPNKTAYDKEVLWPQRCRFLEWIEEQEIELLNWSNKSVLWHGVRREIHETGFFGVSIHPSYLKKLPSALRLSSPYLDRFHPFSHPAGIRELIRLFKDARSKRQRGVQGLQLDNQHPRIGPGKLEQMEAMSYRCGLVPESEDNPSQLVIGVKFVHVKLAGQYFSEGDRAVLLPRQQDCGDPDVQHWAWWAKGIQAPESVQNTSADYWMSCQGQDLQLCFCEAPQCTEAWRFGQSVGASATDSSILPPSVKEQCSKMVEKINTNEVAPSKTGKNHGWGSWARVGDKLFGLPWQVNPVIVLDLNTAKLSTLPTASELKHLDYDLVGLSPSSAVVNECIYSPPFKLGADYMLIVNTTSGKVSTLNHRLYLDGKHIYSAIAAVGTTLYVFPKAGFTQLLSIDVGSAAAYFDQIAIDQELDGCVWPSQESRSWSAAMWYDVAVVDGSLFASPWDAECMLIFHTSNRTFEGIDTTQVARGAAKWSRLLEIRGSIYAAPSNAYYAGSAPSRDILAVDIAQKKARGISVGKCHVGNEWTSMGSHGGYIYILPSRPTNILVLDLQTETTFCFQAGDILGGGGHHFMDTVVANDKLYALPDQEGAILVLDLNIEVTQATENATVATQH